MTQMNLYVVENINRLTDTENKFVVTKGERGVATAAAKSFQSCLTLCDPRQQPTRLPRPWDSPGKNTGVGCHFHLQCVKVKSESEVAQSCPTHSNPMDYSPPGSSVHGILQARVLEWGAIAFSFKVHLLILLYSYESLRVRNFSLLTDEKYNFQRC